MKTVDIRERLHQYIENAQDKKVKAIYTMVEGELSTEDEVEYDEDFLKEIEKRTAEMENGTVQTYSWEEVQSHAKKALQKTLTSK